MTFGLVYSSFSSPKQQILKMTFLHPTSNLHFSDAVVKKLLKYFECQLTKCCLEGRLKGFFMISYDNWGLSKLKGAYNCLYINTGRVCQTPVHKSLIYIRNLARHSFSLFDRNKTQPQTSKMSEQRLAYH